MYHFLESAGATGAAAGSGLGGMILMLVFMFAIMYFLMIRPENKKKKEAERMRNAVKVGDEITTIGGIIGVVCSVKDDKIVIETSADRVRVEFAKWAISTNDSAAREAKAKAEKQAAEKKRALAEKKSAGKKSDK